ncbi:hypothetical protein J2S19_001175 [Metabacillus malikii]|uniref:YhfH family protein n=1 Tax=Metabacillus malikii TaxID=1504265 RepID=A0ABT9ZEC2_9BACI|nr:hypothetical protein [Metabacillus malikii]
MEKIYCSRCMLFIENCYKCKQCGSTELIKIKISIQNQHTEYIVEE